MLVWVCEGDCFDYSGLIYSGGWDCFLNLFFDLDIDEEDRDFLFFVRIFLGALVALLTRLLIFANLA